ncbi:hypothetical protein DFH07DRAFT_781613 [Mycena maculata]|uniref:Uncharacterized protein n=1 Tax=Mycena maculata TaxID=230809 RepID=A0AAD7HYV8_9AGAR|nr:hypothetical protein DFH07DRAFT_781613 [Mycena maculata]
MQECNEYCKAREDAYQHVMKPKRSRDSARNHRVNHDPTSELPDWQPIDEMYPSEAEIAQLPNPELFALMDVDSDDAPGDALPNVALEHVTRVLLCPIFGASREVFYAVDCIDEYMFLRRAQTAKRAQAPYGLTSSANPSQAYRLQATPPAAWDWLQSQPS